MKNLIKILSNQSGHGYVPSFKDLLKIGATILTFPISVPVLMLVDKIKRKRKEKKSI